MAYADGRALTNDEISTVNNWMTTEAKGDKNLLGQKATEYGLTDAQKAQLGIGATGMVGTAWNGGKDLQPNEIANARNWAVGKTGQQAVDQFKLMGGTSSQLDQVFGFAPGTSKAHGYDSGNIDLPQNMMSRVFDGNTWLDQGKDSAATDPAAPYYTGLVAQATTTPAAPAVQAQTKLAEPSVMARTTPATVTHATVTPWNVTPEQTVQYQANNVIRSDSPLMQHAAGMAAQAMNERGLRNSSIAIGAAQDAVLGKALDIARPDAQMYGSAAQFNANANNAASMFNASADNETSRFNAGADNTASMFNADSQNTRNTFNAGQENDNNRFNAGQQNDTTKFNAAANNTASMFNSGQLNTTNLAIKELAQKESQFGRTLTQQQEQFAQDMAFKLKQLGLNVDLAKMDNETRLAVASMGMSGGSISAGSSAAIQEANRVFQGEQNKTNAFNRQYEIYNDRVLKITIDPSLDAATKDRLISSETAAFKGWAKVNNIVGDLTFVDAYGGTNKPATTPTTTTTTPDTTAPGTTSSDYYNRGEVAGS